MLIQPVVENAIRYGLAPKIAEGKAGTNLYISAEKTDEKLFIEVSDNGKGMPAEQIEAIYKGENVSRGRGVGVKNIIERLNLLYGNDYSFTIDSKNNPTLLK
jgi:two-component system sensor histidine kinase YesM